MKAREQVLSIFLYIGIACLTGCTTLGLGEEPFEPEGPLSRIRPTDIRVIVPVVQGKGSDTSISAQLPLTHMATGPSVSVLT